MKAETLLAKLKKGQIVPLKLSQWEEVAGTFQVKDTIDTGMAGQILLLRRPLWALVEEPTPLQRVVRPMAGEKEARALIQERLAAYERMWDG